MIVFSAGIHTALFQALRTVINMSTGTATAVRAMIVSVFILHRLAKKFLYSVIGLLLFLCRKDEIPSPLPLHGRALMKGQNLLSGRTGLQSRTLLRGGRWPLIGWRDDGLGLLFLR